MGINTVVLQASKCMMVWMIFIIGLLFFLWNSPVHCLTEQYFIHSQLKNQTVPLTSVSYSPTPMLPNLVTSKHNYISTDD